MQLIRYAIIATAIGSWGNSHAGDNLIRIGGGPKTGEYITVAQSICDALGKLFKCEAIETKGTIGNKILLRNNEISFGLAKANIAEEWLKEPDFRDRYISIRSIADESLFVFGKPETLKSVGSWTGVRDNAFLLSIGLPGELSGDTAVFNFLKAVPDSPLVNLAVKMYNGREELLAAVKNGDVDMGFITQIPNPENKLFKSIDDAGLSIMGVIDPDMIAFGDTFRIKSVTVKNAKWLGFGGSAQQIETANVPMAIVATKPEAMQGRVALVQKAAIKKITDMPETDLLPKQGWMQKLVNTTTLKVGAGLDEVLQSMSKAAQGAKERLQNR